MLYSLDTGKYVKTLPHEKDYKKWKSNLSDEDYKKIVDALNCKIDGSDINTSSWIPGSEWAGTVYEPLYFACKGNPTKAGMFFGLILFKLMLERDDVWGFGKYEKNGVSIKGITYFLLNNPPAFI